MKFPLSKGLCVGCPDRGDCPLQKYNNKHKENIKKYGEDYYKDHLDLWNKYALEEPVVTGKIMQWCPIQLEG